MADLTITAASVIPGANATKETGIAGATVTAGQTVYKEAATGQFKLADSNSATAEVRTPYGIALHASLAGQPLTVQTSGQITIGATVAVGTAYMQSETPGGIQPAADIATGEYATLIGFAITAAIIDIRIVASGVAVP